MLRLDPFRDFDMLAARLLGPASHLLPVDVARRGDTLVARFDLPGVAADTIDVTVAQRLLTVSAERRGELPDEEMLVCERPHGVLRRQLTLPGDLDVANVAADYRDGVLTVTVPVAPGVAQRRVPVSAGESGQLAA